MKAHTLSKFMFKTSEKYEKLKFVKLFLDKTRKKRQIAHARGNFFSFSVPFKLESLKRNRSHRPTEAGVRKKNYKHKYIAIKQKSCPTNFLSVQKAMREFQVTFVTCRRRSKRIQFLQY